MLVLGHQIFYLQLAKLELEHQIGHLQLMKLAMLMTGHQKDFL